MKRIIFVMIMLVLGQNWAQAQVAIRARHFNLEKGIAIQGFDPIAYFISNKAIKGNSQMSTTFDGIRYYFSTQSNLELFLKEPKKFEPQYGGWCAYAMGAGNGKVEIDPETFKIVEGKLYLFYHSWTNNTLTKWNEDERNLKAKADKNWNLIFK